MFKRVRNVALKSRRRKVRLHLQGSVALSREGAETVAESTLEGLLVGRRRGHYILRNPRVLVDNGESLALKGTVKVPEKRVVFCQVLSQH